MSADVWLRQTDTVGLLTRLLRDGLGRIDVDLDRMGQALARTSPDTDRIPIGAFSALDAASHHAQALGAALAAVPVRHPASTHARAGLDAFVAGLATMRRAWLSYGGGGASRTGPLEQQATASLVRARVELLAADRALGCPFGCPAVKPLPPKPTLGSTP